MRDRLKLYAQATEKSLENAEQWIEDAKLLIDNSSFGHASALLRFACEELSKAFVCWAVSEKLYPTESTIIRKVFYRHEVKNRLLIGFALMIKAFELHSKKGESSSGDDRKLSVDELVEGFERIEKMVKILEKVRQKSIYVDRDFDEMNVTTPLSISKKEVLTILKGTENYQRIVRHYVENFSEEKKKLIREFAASIPKEFWNEKATPEVVEWFADTYGVDLDSS